MPKNITFTKRSCKIECSHLDCSKLFRKLAQEIFSFFKLGKVTSENNSLVILVCVVAIQDVRDQDSPQLPIFLALSNICLFTHPPIPYSAIK